MARHYATRDFFRQMPNPLLARYFRAFLVVVGVSVGCAWTWPGAFPEADPVAVLVRYYTPNVYRAVVVWYYVAPGVAVFLAGQFLLATSRIWFARMGVSLGLRSRLPMWPLPPTADGPAIVVGEVHHPVRAIESPAPEWLTIRERGLYTGVAIVGAVGSGKTSACMHPFARQLLSWQATNPERRAAALVLEVKGDFCDDIRRMLTELGQRWRLHRAVPRWPADMEPAECDLAPCVLARLHGRVPLESPLRQGQRTLLAPGWRNPKHVQNWQASLTRHAFPRIGDVPGSELTTADVIEALRPIPAAITIAVLLVEPSREL